MTRTPGKLTLFLLRHAKSSWDVSGLRDFDRSLSERGYNDRVLIGNFIGRLPLTPEKIICSAAQRTRETLAGILPYLNNDLGIEISKDIYYGDEAIYLNEIHRTDSGLSSLMLIGHNPTIHNLALNLIDESGEEPTSQIQYKYPTSGLSIIEFEQSDWRKIIFRSGQLINFVTPKILKRDFDFEHQGPE